MRCTVVGDEPDGVVTKLHNNITSSLPPASYGTMSTVLYRSILKLTDWLDKKCND